MTTVEFITIANSRIARIVATARIAFMDDWMDDHVLCFKVSVNDIPVSFWWGGWEAYAHAMYAHDSVTARTAFVGIFQQQIVTLIESYPFAGSSDASPQDADESVAVFTKLLGFTESEMNNIT